jgi:hypothetical protein
MIRSSNQILPCSSGAGFAVVVKTKTRATIAKILNTCR